MSDASRPGAVLLVRVLLLLAAGLALMRAELREVLLQAVAEPEAAHLLAFPVLAALYVAARREAFAEAARTARGSMLGVLVVLAGAALFALATWPFNYRQVRLLSFVLIAAGAVAAAGGWRTLRLALPALILFALAIPVGTRYLARIVIVPETITLNAGQLVFDLLPGVDAHLEGLDLLLERDADAVAVALGEPHRGAALLSALLSLGTFLLFVRPRPWWQIALGGLGMLVATAAANLVRYLALGVAALAWTDDPFAGGPRLVAAALAFLCVALGTGLTLLVLDRLVVTEEVPA